MPLLFLVSDEETALPLNDQLKVWYESLPGWQLFRQQGAIFTQHRTASTACPPARACLYTGKELGNQDDAHHHTVDQVNGLAKETFPALQGKNLGHYFREAGYRTYYLGKWHLCPDPTPEIMETYGWTGWFGPEPHGPDYETSGWTLDEQYTKAALDLIHSQPDNRFVLALNLVNPHDINLYLRWKAQNILPELLDLSVHCEDDNLVPNSIEVEFIRATREDLWVAPELFDLAFDLQEYRRFYYTCLQKVDSYFAQVISSFQKHWQGMIIRTSDHGSALGTSGGLLGKWMTGSDYVLRVPLGIWYPGISPRSYSHLTSSVDVLPTILDHHRLPYDLPGCNVFFGKRKVFRFYTRDNPTRGPHQYRFHDHHPYQAINFDDLTVEITSSGRTVVYRPFLAHL
ncbi:MAG: sulfatase-like hydrolase/transferase [Nitrososphaerales archaeon]